MKFLDINGVSILWARIKETFARKSETVSDISRDDTTFMVTRADGTTFEFTQKDTTYDIATTTTSGLMSATDKAKLNGMESGAQENVIESVSVNGTEQSVTNKGVNITVPTALSDLTDDVGYLTKESDPTVPTWAKQPQKPAYTASEVGALPADTHIPTDVSELNNDAGYLTEHQDISGIEDAIAGLTTKLNALADSDDTTLDQLSEIVAYIKNNKSLIDGITTGKVSVDDIVDNLTSTAVNKPLSAKQGKVLKDMIDSIVVPTKVSELTNDAEYITSSDVATPNWNAAFGDDGYIDNKPNIRKGTDANGTAVAAGSGTTASGLYAFAEGSGTRASGDSSHSEGGGTTASGNSSHAEGNGTIASGGYSHAEGIGTQAMSDYQHVQGKYNIADNNGTYAHIVGGGTSGWNNMRKNIHTLDWDGNAWYAGKVTVGTAPTADLDVATKKYVDDSIPVVPTKTSDLTNDSGFQTAANVATAISTKQDALPTGTAGQVLTLDNNLSPTWAEPSGGSSAPEIYIGSTTPSGYTVYIDPDGMIDNAKGASF